MHPVIANTTRSFAVLGAVAVAGSIAVADGPHTATVDVSSVRDKLALLHDGSGHFVAVVPFGDSDHVYYAHNKTAPFHQQRVYGASRTKNERMSRTLWSPFVKGNATLAFASGKWLMRCGDRKTPLSPVSEAERTAMLAKAKFKAPLWKRQAYALSRDDRGIYYYVDRLRDEYGGLGFRLFKGRKGQMKRQKMIDIVHDSQGDIFATKKGDLRLILSKGQSTWIEQKGKAEQRKSLVIVPVSQNTYLAYVELGVYNERFGTPCDDM